MSIRAQWKGFLKLSLVSCPIALYPATSSNARVSFRQINRQTGNRIKQQLVDAITGSVVEPGNKARGYEIGKDEYLLIEDDELDALQVESTRVIEIDSFVPRNQIDPRYVDAPYYIAPDGKVGQEAFAVIREAMRAKDMVGIGRVVLSSRERPIVVEPFGKGVRAFTLNYPYDVRSEAAYFESISDAAVPRELLELAEAIVDSKASDFNPEKFVDRYENAVVEMLRAKQAGKPAPKAKVQEPSGNVVNLMDTLRASIKATKSAVVGRPVDLNPNHNAGGDAAEAAAAPRKATKTKTAPTTAARKKKSA